MITVTLNGKELTLSIAPMLTEFLAHHSNCDSFALAINEEFVPRSSYASITLQEGDRIELVSPYARWLERMTDSPVNQDPLVLDSRQLQSRLFIGTALYPSPAIMQSAILASGSEVATVALRRQLPEQAGGHEFWALLKETNTLLLPNTAGCFSVKEAVTTAQMARELFDTRWIKLEVIGDEYNLQPDPFGLLEATKELIAQDFKVFPYCTDDLVLCDKLVEAGCEILMPWGAPIGTGKGLINPYALNVIRERLPDITLVVDAGIGRPSHAAQAMELGYDAVLLNTAIANAADPVRMASAFKQAVIAGREAYLAGAMPERELAKPSTPDLGKPFWHSE